MEQAQGPEPPRAQHLGRKRGGRWGLTGPAAAESKDRCPCPGTPMEKVEVDHRSSYVGNVDSGGPAEELEAYFNHCREVQRVTILCDKFSGYSKDFAYIEFATESAGQAAVELDERIFRGRVIKVLPKRTNLPGINSTDGGGCGDTAVPGQHPSPTAVSRAGPTSDHKGGAGDVEESHHGIHHAEGMTRF